MQLSKNDLTTAESKKSSNIDRAITRKTSNAQIASDAQSLKGDCLELVDQLHDDSINFNKSISTEELYDSIEIDNYNNIKNIVSNPSDKLKTENPKELNEGKLKPNQPSSRKIVNNTKERADPESKVNEEGTNNSNDTVAEVTSTGSLLDTVSSVKLTDQASKSDSSDLLDNKKRKKSIQ